MFTKKRPDTAPSTSSTSTPAPAELPAGHDNERSPWFIPDELREHYVRGTARDVWEYFYDPTLGRSRRAAAAEQKMRQDPQWREYFAHEDRRAADMRRGSAAPTQHQKAKSFQYERATLADELGPDDLEAVYHRAIALPAARRARAVAQQTAEVHRALVERSVCHVCGSVGPATRAMSVDWSRAVVTSNVPSAGGPSNLCAYCAALVPELVTAVRADDDVNGRTRRDAVAAWLQDRAL